MKQVINTLCVCGAAILIVCLVPDRPQPTPVRHIDVLYYDSGAFSDHKLDMLDACEADALSIVMDVASYKFSVQSCLIKNGVAI